MSSVALLLLVTCTYTIHGVHGSLQFVAKKWGKVKELPFKVAFMGDALPISCQTNDPYNTVYLLKQDFSNRWSDAVNRYSGQISRMGQIFLIKELNIRNSGIYKCVATNTNGDKEEMKKGRLIVNNVQRKMTPEIYPNVPVLSITLGRSRYITCKTIGAAGKRSSFLTWYRQNEYGQLVKVDSARVVRSGETIGGNNIDVETLVFQRMKESYVGKYVCERKVYNSNPTRKSILVNTDPVFEFITKEWKLDKRVSIKMAYIDDSMFISCQTNALIASVLLLRRKSKSEPWRNARSVAGTHITQIGQTFLIKGVRLTDSVYYKCMATNVKGEKIELAKGLLVVSVANKYVSPEIFPGVATLAIPSYTAKNITCKAVGMPGTHRSFLRWYRKKNSRFVYVKRENIHRREENIGGNHVDIETLMFTNFGWNDVGEYRCVRKVPNARATSKTIHIEMKDEINNSVS